MSRSIHHDKFGVKVQRIEEDDLPYVEDYDPSHPDANSEGVVQFPNVNLVIEMINLVSIQHAYEANVNAIMSDQAMTDRTQKIIRQ